jgi:hypothetical protein
MDITIYAREYPKQNNNNNNNNKNNNNDYTFPVQRLGVRLDHLKIAR